MVSRIRWTEEKQRGFSSFVAEEPFQGYQMDSVFCDSDSVAKVGLTMTDTFTKFVWVVGVRGKTIPDVLSAITEC